MRFYILVLAFVLAINIVAGSDCNVNCTGGVEDDLFTKPSTYGAWGLSYVRDGTRPKLQEPHSAVYKRAVISIHGNGRDVYNYYCFGKYAIEDAGLYDETYLIAPRFPLPIDNPPAGAFYWVNSASWKEGGRSHSDTSRISSFEILDDIIVAFNNKTLFPGLVEIIVVGHSAGGQTAQRYAISSGIDSMSTLPIRYVIENSGSYTYLDTSRPVLAPLSLPTCTACIPEEIVSRTYSFAQGGYGNCSEFNDWKMGIANGNVYVNRRTAATIRAEYGQKDIAYIFSQNDTCNTELGNCGCSDSSLDTGCDALEQGYCRLERGIAYYQYLQYYYGTPTHSYDIVPNAAHEGCKVMTSIQSLRAMFPNAILPADCLNSVSVQQSFTVGWQSSGKSFTQWAGTVTTSSLPIYGITLHITAPSGAEVTSVWGIAPITPGSSYYKVQDWRLQSGRPVPPNSSLSFGYIVSSTTKASIVAENASCKK